MKKMFISIVCLVSTFAFAEEPVIKPEIAQQVLEASEAIGALTAIHLKALESYSGIKFDTDIAVQVLKDALTGQKSLKPEMEYMRTLDRIQEASFKQIALENLKKTETFLSKNKTAPGVKEIIPNKLQYRVEKEGSGPVVEENSTPLVRYIGKFQDDSASGSPQEEESRFDLASDDELMPGFRKSLIGMIEGEERTVFIHPELIGAKDNHFPPNSLLTYKLQVLKVNAPSQEPMDSLSNKHNPEIATPFEDQKVVR